MKICGFFGKCFVECDFVFEGLLVCVIDVWVNVMGVWMVVV